MTKKAKKLIKFSPLIKENIHFLKNIQQCGKSRPKIRALLNSATGKELLCLVETCFNLLKGRIPIPKRSLNSLKKQAGTLRKLSRCRSSKTARAVLHRGIPQKGEGLPLVPALLANIILPVLAEKIISKTFG
jgi:hypothetical protein